MVICMETADGNCMETADGNCMEKADGSCIYLIENGWSCVGVAILQCSGGRI